MQSCPKTVRGNLNFYNSGFGVGAPVNLRQFLVGCENADMRLQPGDDKSLLVNKERGVLLLVGPELLVGRLNPNAAEYLDLLY